jgi:UDP-2-acetamido-3-amino-2,3-dideoxy-glucuronate N-acetyltransferase
VGAGVAVVGAGYWGRNLIRNFRGLGALAAICEADTSNPVLRQYPDVPHFASYEALLASPGIGAIALATPAVMHHAMARQALLSGKDVFVEKPLALTADEGQELASLAAERGRVLMVGHILRYHPAVLALRELIHAGELGRMQYIYSNRLNIGKLRTEENILWSFAPHDISVILMLVEELPQRVVCTGGEYLSRGVADTTVTLLSFARDVKAHIFVSWLHPFKEQKIVVVGSKAMAVFDDLGTEKLVLYPHTISWADGKVPVAKKAERVAVPVGAEEPLRAELRHFLERVEDRREPDSGGAEGVRVLKVLAASEASMAQGGLPITLDQPGARDRDAARVHPTAVVDEHVELGAGTRIWHFSHVLDNVRIGERCVIGQNVTIGPDVRVGNRCKIQNNVSVYKGVTLEDEVFCGPSCVFTNVYTPRAFIERKHEFLPTLVRRGATIGANATVVCGVTIGEYAMVGAGAVVKRDVPAHAIVSGVPARQHGWACRCGLTLTVVDGRAACRCCSEEYTVSPGGVQLVRARRERG